MKRNDLPRIARQHLHSLLEVPGGLLYSSYETLAPGPVYLLGYNPGGEGGLPLHHSIDALTTFTDNAYLDECWSNRKGTYPPGKAPLQKNAQRVIALLDLDVARVCASNLIFVRSREAGDVPAHLANQCWPVHEAILSLVQPRLILTIGNGDPSAYSFLKQQLGCRDESHKEAGHGNYALKRFETSFGGKSMTVAGLPHLSRYHPGNKPEAIQWLSQLPVASEEVVEV